MASNIEVTMIQGPRMPVVNGPLTYKYKCIFCVNCIMRIKSFSVGYSTRTLGDL